MFEYTCTAPSVIRPGQLATWVGTDRGFALWLARQPRVTTRVRYLHPRMARRAGSPLSRLLAEEWARARSSEARRAAHNEYNWREDY